MKSITVGNVRIEHRPSCMATFSSIYGIGIAKAVRLNAFLLNHPDAKVFKHGFEALSTGELTRNIFYRLFLDKKIRLYVSNQLKDKIIIFCYQAYRIFQDLPTKGQRTKANAGTPSHLNPYLSLKINLQFYPKLALLQKKRTSL